MLFFPPKANCFILVALFVLCSSVLCELIVEYEALRNDISLRNVSASFGVNVRTYGQYHAIQALAANTNGDLAIALTNNEILIYSTVTHAPKRLITSHTALIPSLSYSTNGLLVSASHDYYARLFNMNEYYLSKCYTFSSNDKFTKVIAYKDTNYLLARNNIISVQSLTHCGDLKYMTTNATLSMTFLRNDDLVSGSADKSIKVWNWRDGILKRTFPTSHTDGVTALAQLAGGELVSGSADKTIKIWNPNDGTLIHTMTGHTGPISALAVLPNGYLASSSSAENIIRIWDTYRGFQLYSFAGHTAGVNDLVILPSGELASAGIDRRVRIWTTK